TARRETPVYFGWNFFNAGVRVLDNRIMISPPPLALWPWSPSRTRSAVAARLRTHQPTWMGLRPFYACLQGRRGSLEACHRPRAGKVLIRSTHHVYFYRIRWPEQAPQTLSRLPHIPARHPAMGQENPRQAALFWPMGRSWWRAATCLRVSLPP